MENQTTAPVEQSEQPKDVAQPEATPEVKETVLDDLKKRSHFYNTTHVKGDSHESAFYEGQRSLVVFMESLINHKQ